MKQFSRSVVFVDINPKNERIALLKSHASLSQLDNHDTNVFKKSLIDRYQHRTQNRTSMCLAQFATIYDVNDVHSNSACDAIPPPMQAMRSIIDRSKPQYRQIRASILKLM